MNSDNIVSTKRSDSLRGPVSQTVIESTDPFGPTSLSVADLSESVDGTVDPDDVRAVLDDAEWAYRQDDDGHVWIFDRHVVFSQSVEDLLSSYPDRYDEGQFQ